MKKITAIISMAVMILFAASCKKDDTIRYNNITMGNVVNGLFISDQGNTFHVVENNSGREIENEKRAIIACDVLKQVPGKENEYEVRLNQVASVFTKQPVKASEVTDEEVKVEDPISINDIWFAGGYVNLQIMFLVEEKSTTTHMINLVLDDSNAEEGYRFTLRHNAYGDLLTESSPESNNYILGVSYVSFPISSIIKEDEAKLTFDWKWYAHAGFGLSTEIDNHTYSYNWKRNSFEQAPLNLAQKAVRAVR